jgi:hypothetical protein
MVGAMPEVGGGWLWGSWAWARFGVGWLLVQGLRGRGVVVPMSQKRGMGHPADGLKKLSKMMMLWGLA